LEPFVAMVDASEKLLFPPTLAQLYAHAYWDPKPTASLKSQRQLAYALGYPHDWRVERTIDFKEDGTPIIRDRIHAFLGKKRKSQYTWLHHEAAQAAAAKLEAEGNLEESHLLPPVPKYSKGDVVQVEWEGKCYDATILKRKKQGDSFLYSVYYPQDEATQDDIEEHEIRPGQDPTVLAAELGFPRGWKASQNGSRYTFTAPEGDRFTSKNAALKFLKKLEEKAAQDEEDMGDPPWRKVGHEWIGRQVSWSSDHKISGRRSVTLEQVGTITGFIKATDVDKEGNPGFVSELTGQPTDLFHVVFKDQPHHQYASFLINSQDLEETEVIENLLDETPAQKRKREATVATTERDEAQKEVTTPVNPNSSAKKKRKRRSI
jgi:hypothetical protein